LSFDASVKVHYSGRYTSTKTSRTGYGGIHGYIHHIDRGTDRKNGCEVQHGNPDINPDYTLENESYYKDSNGEWKETSRSKDMVDAINRRVDYARKNGARISAKGQNDTVVVRPLVVQLDSDVVTGHEDTWMWDAVGILEDMFGKDNIPGFSVHRDETNVHMHVAFVPCHETGKADGETKCTLSQSKFFRNPKQLAAMHRKIRKTLCDKGYDVEKDNKPIEEHLAGYYDKQGEWHQQGLTPEHLKELTNKQIQLQLKELKMKLRNEQLDKLEQAMKEIEETTKARQEEVKQEHEILAKQKAALDNDRATVQEQIQALIREKVEVEQAKSEADETLEKVLSVYQVCSQILDEEKQLNAKFMEFLDREGTRTGRKVREYVEYLYDKFQKERRENLSGWQMEMLRLRNERSQNASTNNIPDIIASKDSSANYSFSV